MFPLLNLRILVVYALIFSLFVTGLITLTTRRSHASNNSLLNFRTPTANESQENTAPQAVAVDEATRSRVSETLGKLPLSFEENRGQVNNEVKYVSRGAGYTLFLTSTEAILTLRKADEVRRHERPSRDLLHPHSAIRTRQSAVLRMKLRGANSAPVVTGESEIGARTNYFIGNDPQKWHTEVSRYERVRYAQVYPGIDTIYYGQQRQLEYDFEVAPGADTRQIALEFADVKRMKVERATGDLIFKTAGGTEVRQRKPVAYQEVEGGRREVNSRYVLKGGNRVGIEVWEYDRTKKLVIDPVLSYSTYLGGWSDEIGYGIAVDSSGYAYVTGYTFSYDFPVKNQYHNGGTRGPDVFVMKLDTNRSGGPSLLYSTFLGGNDGDIGYAIAVDSSGRAYVTGETRSSDFPTKNEYQTYRAGRDAFVAKIDTTLSGADSLLYSTYLGGYGNDYGKGIAADSSGHAYVSGETDSFSFPTKNQYQESPGGYYDAFAAKIDTNASGADSLLYSTYLGGGKNDYGKAIAIDALGRAYVAGLTRSSDFPTKNRYQAYQGYLDYDAFVTKLDMSLSGAASLLYSTYLGRSGDDRAYGIAADSSGHAYVTGETHSDNFPTKNQYQTFQGYADAFVAKLDTNRSGAASLLYSTLLGGASIDIGYGIAVDSSGRAYVTGSTHSDDFPMKNQYPALHPTNGDDAFVAKIDTTLSGADSLLYSTFLRGVGDDRGYGIAADSVGHAYVTGETDSIDFPRFHQYQIGQGAIDVFVTKLTDSYTIGGRVTSDGATGIGGVTMKIGGSQTRTTVTNGAGSYAFAGLVTGGDYTITASKSGLTFIPSEQSFDDLHADRTEVDFTTQPAAISGKVTNGTATGAGLGAVTMTLTGGAGFTPRTVTTASNGVYSFTSLPTPGNYKITPSKTNYLFNPSYLVLNNVTTNQTAQNFIATLKTYTITGRVTRTGTTTGISAVTVTVTSPTPAGFAARTVQTTSTGVYSFTTLPAGRNYTIKPTKTGYTFSPATRSITNLSGNISAGAATNFTGTQ